MTLENLYLTCGPYMLDFRNELALASFTHEQDFHEYQYEVINPVPLTTPLVNLWRRFRGQPLVDTSKYTPYIKRGHCGGSIKIKFDYFPPAGTDGLGKLHRLFDVATHTNENAYMCIDDKVEYEGVIMNIEMQQEEHPQLVTANKVSFIFLIHDKMKRSIYLDGKRHPHGTNSYRLAKIKQFAKEGESQ